MAVHSITKIGMNGEIKYIEHIYDYRTNTFFDFTKIKQLYNVSNSDYLKYFKLISSIPQTWRARLRNETINTQNNIVPLLIKVQSSKQCNKLFIYHFLSKITNVDLKSRTKWNAEFSEKEINWKIVNTHILDARYVQNLEISSTSV